VGCGLGFQAAVGRLENVKPDMNKCTHINNMVGGRIRREIGAIPAYFPNT
jgi:hypothetical protein